MRVEWHKGDLADLAFLRADSIDVAFSADALAEVDDLGAAVPPGAAGAAARTRRSCSRYEHPMALVHRAPTGAVAALVLRRRARSTSNATARRHASTPAASARCSPSSAAPVPGRHPRSSPRPDTPRGRDAVPATDRRGAPARKAPDPAALVRRCRRSAARQSALDAALAGPRVEPRVGLGLARSGPRRGAPRAGSRAPRRRRGPGGTPRNSITCRPSSGGRIASSSSCSRSSAIRASSSSIRRAARVPAFWLRVVQSHRCSWLSSSSRSPASRT